jgi:23S rRNA (uracil1939-C5)-methyltransferase
VVEVASDLDREVRSRGVTDRGEQITLRGALPGERLQIEIEHVSGAGRAFGVARRVERAAKERIPADCPHFLSCGGCDLLHLERGAQLALKRRWVAEALEVPLERIDPVLFGPTRRGYRALAKLVVGEDRRLGSYRPFSHQVAEMTGCRIHAPIVERVAEVARRALLELPPGPIDLRYLVLRASLAEQRVLATLICRSLGSPAAAGLAQRLAAEPAVAQIVVHQNDRPGDAIFGAGPEVTLLQRDPAPVERVGAIELSLESAAFSQINPEAAALIYRRVVEGLAPRGQRVVDLYSGSGGVALSLAAAGAEVYGVERSAEGVRAATSAAARMGLAAQARFVAADAAQGLAAAPPSQAVVLNPPRKGAAAEVLRAIAARAPQRLAYVSCDPRSLARDLEALRGMAPLALGSITPVDLFPETRHVETVVIAEVGAGG